MKEVTRLESMRSLSADRLTPRERQVLQMLWDGLPLKAVAAAMDLSFTRVRQIRVQLGWKLDAATNVQLVRAGLEQGFLTVSVSHGVAADRKGGS